jgi:carboxymethylenebutenolidase
MEVEVGQTLTLTASDGHSLAAYRCDPGGRPRGGVVVLQEIFGVNVHIREVTEGFAKDGFVAIAPALFDRSSVPGIELGYTAEDIARGRKIRDEFSWDDTVKDVEAAMLALRAEGLKVATVGYCWGGSISFLGAVRLPLEGAVVYYGGQIKPYIHEKERCPLLMHFGKKDAGIPLSEVEAIAKAHPAAVVHLYDADHGFNCDRRAQFDPTAAALAKERTHAFLTDRLR